MTTEVKVTRSVDVDALFGAVIQRTYYRMAQAAANAAMDRAPVDRGYLKANMALQSGDVTYTGNGVSTVAVWKPSERKKPERGKGPIEYGAYLDNPVGGTEQVPAGPRTYPAKRGKSRGSGKLFGKHKGTWTWPATTRQLSKGPKYQGTQRKGSPTRGWFNPGVVDDLRSGDDITKIVDEAAREIEVGWNR